MDYHSIYHFTLAYIPDKILIKSQEMKGQLIEIDNEKNSYQLKNTIKYNILLTIQSPKKEAAKNAYELMLDSVEEIYRVMHR